jgi:proteic killer suppression protein
MLNNAADLRDLRVPPNNQLETLVGDRKGQHSIRVNRQWRICFHWQDGDAYDVELGPCARRRAQSAAWSMVNYHGG